MMGTLTLAFLLGMAVRLLIDAVRHASLPRLLRHAAACLGALCLLTLLVLTDAPDDLPQNPEVAFRYGAFGGMILAAAYFAGAGFVPSFVRWIARVRLAVARRQEAQR